MAKLAVLFQELMAAPHNDWVHQSWFPDYLFFTQQVKKLRELLLSSPESPLDAPELYASFSNELNSYAKFMEKWLKESANGIAARGQSVLSEEKFQHIIGNEQFKVLGKAIILQPSLQNYNAFRKWWREDATLNTRVLHLIINRSFAACHPEKLSSTVHERKFWEVINGTTQYYGFKWEQNHHGNWYEANCIFVKWLDKELKEVLLSTESELEKQIKRNIFVWLLYEKFVPNEE